jgi:hypothetical protein
VSFVFQPGQTLGHNDLAIKILTTVTDPDTNEITSVLTDADTIAYNVFRIDRLAQVPLLENQTPTRYAEGWYYLPFTVSEDWADGEYWAVTTFTVNGGAEQKVIQRFFIYPVKVDPNSFDSRTFGLVRRLRNLLRDNHPDRNYHFMPPRHVEEVNAFTKRVGFIWEDYELADYLDMSLGSINLSAPATEWAPESLPKAWETILLYGAAQHALFAITTNWIADEFGYSISGINLDLQKSAKYQSMADAMATQFDKQLDKAKATLKFMTGLRQAKYAISIQGYLGPYTARGIISARNYTETSLSIY